MKTICRLQRLKKRVPSAQARVSKCAAIKILFPSTRETPKCLNSLTAECRLPGINGVQAHIVGSLGSFSEPPAATGKMCSYLSQ